MFESGHMMNLSRVFNEDLFISFEYDKTLEIIHSRGSATEVGMTLEDFDLEG